MKKFLLYSVTMLLAIVATTACSKDKDENEEVSQTATAATIQLVDANGNVVKGISVYAYDETTYQMHGDNDSFADFQVVSDSSGNATFTNLDKGTQFTSLNNYTNTYTFSAHYSLNGNNKTKRVSITLKKGDNKTEKLVLN